MKELYKLLILVLSVCSVSFPQMSDISRLPVQNQFQNILESSPVVISDSEIIIFFITNYTSSGTYGYLVNDTIYSSRSTNGGISWQEPEFVQVAGNGYYQETIEPHSISALKTASGRILLCWVDWNKRNISLIYSDDKAFSWSNVIFIEGAGLPGSALYDLNLSELNNGKIILSFNRRDGSEVHYKESNDNGKTWSEEAIVFYSGTFSLKNLSMIEIQEQRIISFFDYGYQSSGIYKKISTDGGLSWSSEIPVIDSPEKEYRPRIVKSTDSDLWLIYQQEDSSYRFDKQTDIYFVRSFDGGNNWSSPQRFTSYVGEDHHLNAALFKHKPFLTFSSTRVTNKGQISYTLLGDAVESFRPPYIKDVFAQSDSLEKMQWLIVCKIIDDEEVVSATVSLENGTPVKLFDDGEHNDNNPYDDIYANTVSFDYYPPSGTELMNVNKLKLSFNNSGALADVPNSYIQNSVIESSDNSDNLSVLSEILEISGSSYGTYDEKSFLFSGGFFLSGYSNDELWTNGVAGASLIKDYLPGNVGMNPDNPLNVVYTVLSTDPPFGYSWQRWKDAVSLGADFYDGDNDGIYNPVDKNWNGIWDLTEDMPDLLGDKTSWCVFNDAMPKSFRRFNVEPQGIEVHQTLFATSFEELDEVIFVRYKIINRGTVADVMDSVFFAFWNDPDLGSAYDAYMDDLVGCDTLLSSAFTYNDGEDPDYGVNPPAAFLTLLQGPAAESNNPSDTALNNRGPLLGTELISANKNLSIYSFVSFFYTYPGPIENEITMRNKMKGLREDGTPVDPCNFIAGDVRGNVDCSEVNPLFWFSGDPVENIGWINIFETNQRTMMSVGEFILEKDKPVTIIGAYVLGRGTDHLNSITVARENVQRAIEEYESNFASMTYDPGEPVYPVVDYVLYQNYPNPFNPVTTIRYEIPMDGVVTTDLFDILGQKVKTLVNEFKKADRYEVRLDATGLASGVYIYRMKVNDFIQSRKMLLLR